MINKSYKNNTKERLMNNRIVQIVLAIFLPPIAVFFKKGAGKDLAINVILSQV